MQFRSELPQHAQNQFLFLPLVKSATAMPVAYASAPASVLAVCSSKNQIRACLSAAHSFVFGILPPFRLRSSKLFIIRLPIGTKLHSFAVPFCPIGGPIINSASEFCVAPPSSGGFLFVRLGSPPFTKIDG